MDSTSLPPRLKESMFRRFEVIIASIVRQYPDVTYVDRGNMSAATVSARLRDAMLSLYKFEWPTTIVDVAKFRTNYEDIVVSHRDTSIIVGSKAALNALAQVKPLCEILPLGLVEEPTAVLDITPKEGALVCRLAAAKAFARPVAIRGIDDENVEYFEENFDVRIDKKDNGIYYVS